MIISFKTRGLAIAAVMISFLLLVFLPAPTAYSTEKLVGVPLNKKVPVNLGKDLGFGKKFNLSLQNNYQDWGVQKVSGSDGFPVRLGNYSIRFETREGFCGRAGRVWSDCRNGRSRHELSTAVHSGDPWNRERWYALSLFLPQDYKVTRQIGTSIFQFLASGKPNWMFKYQTGTGFFVQREFKFTRTVLISPAESLNRWHDFVIRIKHSMTNKGVLAVWVNGERAFNYKGVTAKRVSAKKRPFFKFGIYNTAMGPNGAPIDGGGFANGKGLPNHVLYFDEVRAAKSCQSLKLSDLGYDCAALLK